MWSELYLFEGRVPGAAEGLLQLVVVSVGDKAAGMEHYNFEATFIRRVKS
jgi:hypothetical protein